MRRTDENRGDWKEWRRRRAWQLWEAGWQQQEIAELLGASEGAVSQWIKRGRGACEKKDCVEEGRRDQPADSAPNKKRNCLPCSIRELKPMDARGNIWTTERVAALIENQFGVKYHPAHISRLLKRIAYSLQKPVEQASQRNEEAIALWKTEQWPA